MLILSNDFDFLYLATLTMKNNITLIEDMNLRMHANVFIIHVIKIAQFNKDFAINTR